LDTLESRLEVTGKLPNVPLKKDGRVRNEEVLQRVKEDKNILQTIK
jgi:hypothetical protein